jgi:hypothetical protein
MIDLSKFLSGNWTYRSFLNNPDENADIPSLVFGQGKMVVENLNIAYGEINGYFDFGGGYRLNFKGSASYGNPATIRYQGVGIAGTPTAGWIYDYQAYLVPAWPNGENQATALVGSVIRTAPHGAAKAGLAGSFYAVRQ